MDCRAIEGRTEKGKLISCQDTWRASAFRRFAVNTHTRSTSYISLIGITGAQLSNGGDIQHNFDKLRKVSHSPAAVEFGVATPDDAAPVSKMADGVIVGSATVKRITSHQQDPAMIGHVAEFAQR